MYVIGKRELAGSQSAKEGGVQPGELQAYQYLGATTGRRSWGAYSGGTPLAAATSLDNVTFMLFVRTG